VDILLIEPPYKSLKGVSVDCGYVLSLVSLAAYLRRAGVEAAVLSADLLLELRPQNALDLDMAKYAEGQADYERAVQDPGHPVWVRLAEQIRECRPRAVGVTYVTPVKYAVARVAEVVKGVDPEILVVAGGHHPTFCPGEVLGDPHIDLVVRGEGETPLLLAMQRLLSGSRNWEGLPGVSFRAADGGVRSTPDAPLIADLDELPIPARDAVLGCDYSRFRGHFLSTARGCPATCAFCCDRNLWHRKVRRRSVGSVMEEWRHLRETYDVSFVDITDGTFTYDPRYVRAFCERLIEDGIGMRWRCTARFDNLDRETLRLLRKANCVALYFGLESGSSRVLEQVKKGTNLEQIRRVSRLVREAGIVSMVSVLLGLPEETEADIRETLALMRSLECDVFDVNSYIPLPGTPLFDAMSADERARIDWLQSGYKSFRNHFSRCVSAETLQESLLEAHAIAGEAKRRFRRRLPLLAASYATRRACSVVGDLLFGRARAPSA